MTIGRNFVTWQPALTDHQAFTYKALAQVSGKPLIAYVASMEDSTREALGRPETKVSTLEQRLIPKRGFLRFCYRHLAAHRGDIHLFYSPFQNPGLIVCLLIAARMGVDFYLISEPYSPTADGYYSDDKRWLGKMKAMLRPLLYRVYSAFLRRRISGIFAISNLALSQYENAGIPSFKLFPFGYFVPIVRTSGISSSHPGRAERDCLRVIFVGSLIKRKGLDLLQAAVVLLGKQDCAVSVDIFGPGDTSKFSKECPALRYCGMIPFGEAQSVIAQYDVLVLPSRHDGWGVVVNEALCSGVPVICSDTSGAGGVATMLGAGLTFASGNALALSNALERLVLEPSLLQSMRLATAQAAELLQPEVAARYMLDVIQAREVDRATLSPPWYRMNTQPIETIQQ